MQGAASAGELGATCVLHVAPAAGACARCGDYFCSACAGAAPNAAFCTPCDAHVGAIPWESERDKLGSFGAWRRTVADFFQSPGPTARRLPTDGSLRKPAVFAAIMFALHVVFTVVAQGVFVWAQTSSLRAFGEGDSIHRAAVTAATHEIVVGAIALCLLTVMAPSLLVGATRALGGRATYRSAVRAVAYGAAFLLVTPIQLLALLLSPLLAWYLAAWIGRRAQVSLLRPLVIVGIGALLSLGIWVMAARAYDATLCGVVSRFVDRMLA